VTGTGKISGPGTIPLNGIIMWSGRIKNIPDGWALCNGKNGTPDLSNRFIIGAIKDDSGVGDTVGNSGGSSTITLTTANMPKHTHTFDDYVLPVRDGAIGSKYTQGWSKETLPKAGIGPQDVDNNNDKALYRRDVPTGETGQGSSFDILPPYYALAFIMRIE